jgi:hypothetical protein
LEERRDRKFRWSIHKAEEQEDYETEPERRGTVIVLVGFLNGSNEEDRVVILKPLKQDIYATLKKIRPNSGIP